MGKCIQGESAKMIIKVDLFYSIPMLSECAALSHWWCLENISMVIAKWLTLRFQSRILLLAASIIRMQSKIKKINIFLLADRRSPDDRSCNLVSAKSSASQQRVISEHQTASK